MDAKEYIEQHKNSRFFEILAAQEENDKYYPIKQFFNFLYENMNELERFVNNMSYIELTNPELKDVTLDDEEGIEKIFEIANIKKKSFCDIELNNRIYKSTANFTPPKNFYIPNNRFINNINKILKNPEENYDVGKYRKKDSSKLLVEVDKSCIDSVKPLTLYDISVYSALVTLYKTTNQTIFTYNMIYRTMIGDKKMSNTDSVSIENIDNSINKLSNIKLEISEKDADGKTHKIDRPLLNVLKNKILFNEKNKNDCFIIIFNTEKPLLLYDLAVLHNNQIITIENKVLQIQQNNKTLRNSKTRIEIKLYLIRAIKRIKNGSKRTQKNVILLDTLFENLMIPKTRQSRRSTTNYILNCLDYWESIKFINHYQIIKEHKTLKKIIIN